MNQKFKDYLKSNGSSVTPPRLAVFNYVHQHDQVTVQELIQSHPTIDQASIYRALGLFRELGIIQDVINAGRKMVELTDRFDSHHHHISCTQCGKTITITDPEIENRLNQIAQASGITPQSHQIEVSGICTSCAALTA